MCLNLDFNNISSMQAERCDSKDGYIFAVLIQGYRQIAKWIRIILVYRFTALSLNLIITVVLIQG